MYKVTEKDLIGDIEGFPIEVVQKMIERQVEQGNEADVTVFQRFVWDAADGFCWVEAEEGHCFWSDVVEEKCFDTFFEKYPKSK